MESVLAVASACETRLFGHRVSLARLGAEPQALDGAYDRWIMLAGRR